MVLNAKFADWANLIVQSITALTGTGLLIFNCVKHHGFRTGMYQSAKSYYKSSSFIYLNMALYRYDSCCRAKAVGVLPDGKFGYLNLITTLLFPLFAVLSIIGGDVESLLGSKDWWAGSMLASFVISTPATTLAAHWLLLPSTIPKWAIHLLIALTALVPVAIMAIFLSFAPSKNIWGFMLIIVSFKVFKPLFLFLGEGGFKVIFAATLLECILEHFNMVFYFTNTQPGIFGHPAVEVWGTEFGGWKVAWIYLVGGICTGICILVSNFTFVSDWTHDGGHCKECPQIQGGETATGVAGAVPGHNYPLQNLQTPQHYSVPPPGYFEQQVAAAGMAPPQWVQVGYGQNGAKP
ncbi:hypothetical protein HDV00_004236 [Rhizophlyctis rosea]|nr:hypothetical protein HDV00_004236 [Rhizophlyctis rosea]